MAPSKKRGAPASASSKSVRLGKATKKSLANKAAYRGLQKEVFDSHPIPANRKVVHGDTPKPAKYDVELGKRICLMFATDPNMTLLKLNGNPELPTVWHFYEWLRDNPDFEKLYAKAREVQYDVQAEALKELSRNPLIGQVVTTKTKTNSLGVEISSETREHDNVDRSRLIIDTEKWILSKMRPKKYGLQPIEISNSGTDQLNALFESLKTEASSG